MHLRFYHLLFIVFVFFITSFTSYGQQEQKEEVNEFTVFLIGSSCPLDWESPSTLYKTIKKSWIKTTLHKKGKRFMGHASFSLTFPS